MKTMKGRMKNDLADVDCFGAACIVGLIFSSTITRHEAAIDVLKERVKEVIKVSNANAEVTVEKMKRIESVLDSQVAITAHEDEEIQNIIKRLEEIVKDINKLDKDINKLDKEVEQIKHDEKDLRTYYVNYREPVVSDHGVEWASEYRTGEDDE